MIKIAGLFCLLTVFGVMAENDNTLAASPVFNDGVLIVEEAYRVGAEMRFCPQGLRALTIENQNYRHACGTGLLSDNIQEGLTVQEFVNRVVRPDKAIAVGVNATFRGSTRMYLIYFKKTE